MIGAESSRAFIRSIVLRVLNHILRDVGEATSLSMKRSKQRPRLA